ncbi:hypothetical protein C5N14_29290 [Micromonospora sp. MW-13]|nr:hypothetical protein C5N14_29290 [Micromonospora sp. MW-13]
MVDPHRQGQPRSDDARNHMRNVVIAGPVVRDLVEPLPVQILPSLLGHDLRIRKQPAELRLANPAKVSGQLAGHPRAESRNAGLDPRSLQLLLEATHHSVVEVVRLRNVSQEIDPEHVARPLRELRRDIADSTRLTTGSHGRQLRDRRSHGLLPALRDTAGPTDRRCPTRPRNLPHFRRGRADLSCQVVEALVVHTGVEEPVDVSGPVDQRRTDHDRNGAGDIRPVLPLPRPLPHRQSDRRPRGEIHLRPSQGPGPTTTADLDGQWTRHSAIRQRPLSAPRPRLQHDIEGHLLGKSPPIIRFPQCSLTQPLDVVSSGGRFGQFQIQGKPFDVLPGRCFHDGSGSAVVPGIPEQKPGLLQLPGENGRESADHRGRRDPRLQDILAEVSLAEPHAQFPVVLHGRRRVEIAHQWRTVKVPHLADRPAPQPGQLRVVQTAADFSARVDFGAVSRGVRDFGKAGAHSTDLAEMDSDRIARDSHPIDINGGRLAVAQPYAQIPVPRAPCADGDGQVDGELVFQVLPVPGLPSAGSEESPKVMDVVSEFPSLLVVGRVRVLTDDRELAVEGFPQDGPLVGVGRMGVVLRLRDRRQQQVACVDEQPIESLLLVVGYLCPREALSDAASAFGIGRVR